MFLLRRFKILLGRLIGGTKLGEFCAGFKHFLKCGLLPLLVQGFHSGIHLAVPGLMLSMPLSRKICLLLPLSNAKTFVRGSNRFASSSLELKTVAFPAAKRGKKSLGEK